MGAIQSAINSMLGSAASTVAKVKGFKEAGEIKAMKQKEFDSKQARRESLTNWDNARANYLNASAELKQSAVELNAAKVAQQKIKTKEEKMKLKSMKAKLDKLGSKKEQKNEFKENIQQVEQPTVEQPAVEEPKVEQPNVEQPAIETKNPELQAQVEAITNQAEQPEESEEAEKPKTDENTIKQKKQQRWENALTTGQFDNNERWELYEHLTEEGKKNMLEFTKMAYSDENVKNNPELVKYYNAKFNSIMYESIRGFDELKKNKVNFLKDIDKIIDEYWDAISKIDNIDDPKRKELSYKYSGIYALRSGFRYYKNDISFIKKYEKTHKENK